MQDRYYVIQDAVDSAYPFEQGKREYFGESDTAKFTAFLDWALETGRDVHLHLRTDSQDCLHFSEYRHYRKPSDNPVHCAAYCDNGELLIDWAYVSL